jgi:sugar phosphate isomerase/epimerase
MQLAISNLAWDVRDDAAVAALLQSLDVRGVELAPTKVWPKPLDATPAEVRACRRFWEDGGLRIVALQALLFGRPDLTLFDDARGRAATAEYLTGMIRLAEQLGATRLVFGSPKNRARGALALAEATEIATEFFGQIGRQARRRGVVFCVEPNPGDYQCDFITNAAEGLALVRKVNDAGFGLHLDAGGMALGGDPPAFCTAHAAEVRHFHISEPHLAPVGTGTTGHAGFGAALRAGGYAGWVSIEMKPPAVDGLTVIRQSLASALTCYRPSLPPA